MAKRKLITSINITGLGIGMGSVILMLAFIIHELSFDRYHKNSDHIYRVAYGNNCSTPYVMAETFRNDLPAIRNYFRIYSLSNVLIKKDGEFLLEENCIAADSSLFSILDIPILEGDVKHLFRDKNDILISEKMAEKYFGYSSPVGKPIEVSISGTSSIYNISGVFRHFPSNSSLQANLIGNISLAFSSMKSDNLFFGGSPDAKEKDITTDWKERGFKTFFLLNASANITSLEKKGTEICQTHEKEKNDKKVSLQKFTTTYLHSDKVNNTRPFLTSNISTIRIFEGIALLILLIACLNYVLLYTAETKQQLKGIACQKVFGASNGQITCKTFYHSSLIALLSLFPAILFIKLILPYFNELFDKNIEIGSLFKPVYLLSGIGVTLITGLLAGAYVSFYASRLSPVNLFKPQTGNNARSGFIHSGGVVVFQFVIFILLCFTAIIIEKQVRYSVNIPQGLTSENVLIFRFDDNVLRKNATVIKSSMESDPHVLKVASSFYTPPGNSSLTLAFDSKNGEEPLRGEGLFVGTGLIELLKIPIKEGSCYSNESNNYANEIILNEAAAKHFNVTVGDKLGSFVVKGIVGNFHAHSLHNAITPLFLIKMDDKQCWELAVKTDGNNESVINTARKTWAQLSPTSTFQHEMLNDRIEQFYEKEKKQAKTVTFFSFLAIVLAVMGLFGYVSVVLIKRTKEIGVRRVNGAQIQEILTMLNKNFILWVTIAFIIASPIAWYAMNKWLQSFAYKTQLSWWVFLAAGALAVAVALITVSWQSWRAATRNPVEALRYE